MTKIRSSIALSILGLLAGAAPLVTAAPASAALPSSKLVTTFAGPVPTPVNGVSQVSVQVVNNGTRNTTVPWTLTVQLPKTNTSPQVFTMGTLGSLPAGCVGSGTKFTCTYNQALPRFGGSLTVPFTMTMPYSVSPLTFTASANAQNNDELTLNTASVNALQTFVTPAAPPAPATLTSCTGSNLTSFYECTLFSGATRQLSIVMTATGSLEYYSPTGALIASAGGTWSVSGSQLTLNITSNGQPAATFVGQGTTPSCWEGKATFIPTSTYMAMYKVCR